jgi:hypothetical protein
MFGLGKRRGPETDELRTVREQVLDLQSEVKRLRAEWEDMFEKLCRRDDRIRKRQEREPAPDPAPTTTHDLKAALRARVASRGGMNGLS